MTSFCTLSSFVEDLDISQRGPQEPHLIAYLTTIGLWDLHTGLGRPLSRLMRITACMSSLILTPEKLILSSEFTSEGNGE
jgi:hypothetical protein